MVQTFNLRKKNNTAKSSDKTYDFKKFIDTDKRVIDDKLVLKNPSDTWYDCSIFNCENNAKIKVLKVTIIMAMMENGKEVDLEIKELNGKNSLK